jgi:cytochrome c oxidase subunit 3
VSLASTTQRGSGSGDGPQPPDGRSPNDPAAGITTRARASPLAVGVVVWLASELMFFGGLFAAYYTLRGVDDVWPPPDVKLEVWRALLFTAVLVASSFTMHLSVRSADEGDRPGALRWLFVTFVLGAAFLVNLGSEWAGNDFTLTDHAYGSIYYLLTGFHGAHLLGGLALMVASAVAVSGTDSRVPLGPTYTVTAYYWHFVDVVWIGVFLTIFVVQ